MYHNKKISVAIATYNGEKYIEQQLISILNQTVVPDEIIVSDDGSKDLTLEIVEKLANCQRYDQTRIIILRNNPRHGIGGNFEWAITHTTGDYVFVCGQDDIWMQEKVECVIDVFLQCPDARMVCHDLIQIDDANNEIKNGELYSLFKKLMKNELKIKKADRELFLEAVISSPLISGTAICFSANMINKCMPIPVNSAEDQWLQFCAVAENGLYYLDEALTKYRIHNSASHSVGMNFDEKLKKVVNRIRTVNKNKYDMIYIACAMRKYLEQIDVDNNEFENAYRVVNRIYEIGIKEIDAISSSRIVGIYKIVRLFCTDIRYRRTGTMMFVTQLLNILIYSRKKRLKDLGKI